MLHRGKICWHSLSCLAEDSVLMECKDGRCEVMSLGDDYQFRVVESVELRV